MLFRICLLFTFQYFCYLLANEEASIEEEKYGVKYATDCEGIMPIFFDTRFIIIYKRISSKQYKIFFFY